MKIKTGLLSMTMVAAFITADAQALMQRPTIEERTKRIVDTITTVLKLDQAQQTQALTTFMEYYKESDKLREAVQAGTLPEKEQFKKLTTDRDEKLKKFLNPDQLKKFKEDIEPVISNRKFSANNQQKI